MRKCFSGALVLASVPLCLSFLSPGVAAQRYSVDVLRKAAFPGRVASVHAHVTGDFDGDGDVDIIYTTGEGGNHAIFFNDGAGRFTVGSVNLPRRGFYAAIEAGDVDGDGDLDLVTAHTPFPTADTGQTRLFLNDGKANFTESTSIPKDAEWSVDLLLADVDGTNGLDIIVANAKTQGLWPTLGQARLYLNDGKGSFRDATAANLPVQDDYTSQVTVGDLDGDKDVDLFIGNTNRQANRVWINNGSGVFTDASSAWLDGRADSTSGVGFVDLNRDGTLEVLEVNSFDGHSGSESRVLVQVQGKLVGFVNLLPRITDAAPTAITLGDFDHDGDQDAFFGGTEGGRLLIQSASMFIDGSDFWLPSKQHVQGGASFADLDGDKDLDLVIDSGGSESLMQLFMHVDGSRFVNAAAGVLPDSWSAFAPAAAGDVNGDGLVDMVAGSPSHSSALNRLYLQSAGGFVDHSSVLPPVLTSTVAVELVDVDRDRDLDVVFADRFGSHALFLNDGSGRFTDASRLLPRTVPVASSMAVGDIDGDADLDLVIGNEGSPNSVFINAGPGQAFRDESKRIPASNDTTRDVALLDIDGDGDLDLVAANGSLTRPARVTLHRNDGQGRFTDITATHTPNVTATFHSIAWADFDGDRDLDLALASEGLYSEVSLWSNDGKGAFTASATIRTIGAFSRIQAGDFDSDGDEDVYGFSAILVNDGRGSFRELLTRSRANVVVDYDGDGDLDALDGDVVSTNRWRNVFGANLAMLGLSYDIAIDVEAGFPSSGPARLAALWIGDQVLARPIPTAFGNFHLSPAQSVFAGVVLVEGTATARILIPNLPALVGTQIASQALVFHGAAQSTWRLTNVWADRIVR